MPGSRACRQEAVIAGSILTLNAGSSSLTFALFDPLLAPVLRGIDDAKDDARIASFLSKGDADGTHLVIVAHLGRRVAEIEDPLYDHSVLLGLTGSSGDVRVRIGNDNSRVAQTIIFFINWLANVAGCISNAPGRNDGLIFSADIGQHAPEIRAELGEVKAWLGIAIDAKANVASTARICTANRTVSVLVDVDGESMIAWHTHAIIFAKIGGYA
jgi:acetate kinase